MILSDQLASSQPPQLLPRRPVSPSPNLSRLNRPMARLVRAVQELSLARDLEAVMGVVRRAARELAQADGATFVLRDGDQCFYADEDAIAPLWKGQRFPLTACISGWTMLNSKAAVIEDIYADPRIPADVYRPTFVKSLLMVPIRTEAPIGAIGNYWATRHAPAPEEVDLLQALANTTAVAIQNVQLYSDLEQRVKERTAQLEAANRELEAYSYAVSHDLGAPLRSISSFAQILSEDCAAALPADGRKHLERIRTSSDRMQALMDDLLRLSKVSVTDLERQMVDLSSLAGEIAVHLKAEAPGREVQFEVAPGIKVQGDPGLLRIALENLLSNSWKYTARTPRPRIEFGVQKAQEGARVFYVRDNGVGFDPACAGHLFQPFRRLHTRSEFPGTGLGLTTVQRIVSKHGGRVWAEAAPGKGATFYFTLSS